MLCWRAGVCEAVGEVNPEDLYMLLDAAVMGREFPLSTNRLM